MQRTDYIIKTALYMVRALHEAENALLKVLPQTGYSSTKHKRSSSSNKSPAPDSGSGADDHVFSLQI